MSKRRTLVTVDSKALQVLYSSGFVSFLITLLNSKRSRDFAFILGPLFGKKDFLMMS